MLLSGKQAALLHYIHDFVLWACFMSDNYVWAAQRQWLNVMLLISTVDSESFWRIVEKIQTKSCCRESHLQDTLREGTT